MVFLRLKYLFSRYVAVEAGCHSGRQEQKLGIALCGLSWGRWLQSHLLGWCQGFQLAFIDGVSDKIVAPY